MKKVALKTIAILLILTVGISSCGKENNESISLKNTQWKLTGFVDVQTGVLEEVVPRGGHLDTENGALTDGDTIDCRKCYTFTFVTDNEAQGWSILNELFLTFFDTIRFSSTNIPFSKTPIFGGTKIGEPPIPNRYTDALSRLTSYIYYNNEIKLFYDNNKNYLLYKLIQS